MTQNPNQQPNAAEVARGLQILNNLPAAQQVPNVALLIAEAREKMQVPTQKTEKAVEAPDPHVINALLAQASQLADEIKRATAEREQIKAVLKDVITSAEVIHGGEGSIEELTVNGAVVFTYKPVISRVLDQEFIKANFPDTPENHEMWKNQISRPANFK